MDRTESKTDTPLTQPGSLPVRYRLISPDGGICTGTYATALEAASAAGAFWPGLGQRDENGIGWDLQAIPNLS